MRISFKILLVFLAFSLTTSCKGIYKKVDAREVPISGPERAKKNVREGNIIFWKGHVALCLDKKKIIHAYGPKKKVLIMNTKKTINLILKTAKLKVKKISNIKKY